MYDPRQYAPERIGKVYDGVDFSRVKLNAKEYGDAPMGCVRDCVFIRCLWPPLLEPTNLFAVGSGGITVQGPPTPRNVIFPEDTKFAAGTRGDCYFVTAPSCGCRNAVRTPKTNELPSRCEACCTEIGKDFATLVAKGRE